MGTANLLKASYPDGTPAKVTFYRAKTRGDKRISITKLKKYAKAGDNVTLINTDNGERIKILINVNGR